jgi:hypothetical protein
LYFVIVELSLNNQIFEPKLYTSLVNSYEIGEKIIFPIKYCDLAPLSKIGITIYDMKKPFDESIVAGTTVDLFDEKQRLR